MKYTKLTQKIGHIAICTLYTILVLPLIAIMGLFVWLDFFKKLHFISFGFFVIIPVFELGFNWLLCHLFKDNFYNTGSVINGSSVYDVIKTPQNRSRKAMTCFIACILNAIVLIRFLLFFKTKMSFAMIGILCVAVEGVLYYIVGMSAYEQSSWRKKNNLKKFEKRIEEINENQANDINDNKNEPKIVYKFKFKNFPELEQDFTSYSLLKARKHEKFSSLEEKNNVLNEIEVHFETLAHKIFDTFDKIKPNLIHKKTNKISRWEEIIDKPFAELSFNQKNILVGLLNKFYTHILPDDYYNS